jgi:hypothetical protein
VSAVAILLSMYRSTLMTGRAAVILSVAALALCAVAAGGVWASEGLHIAGTEPAEHALSADTPMRLAQRSRMAERAAAVEAAAGKVASDESEEGAAEEQTETDRALDAALVETGAIAHDRSRGRNRGRQGYVPGPAWSRLTGASKTYVSTRDPPLPAHLPEYRQRTALTGRFAVCLCVGLCRYHPNDQMCVLCQFLVERTQLDLAQ